MQVDWKMRLKVRPILMCWRVPLPVDTPEEAGANSTPTTRGGCTVLWGGVVTGNTLFEKSRGR